jgi:hypothetical protein
LEKNPLEGVLAVEMFATSFGPEVIEQKAPEDVEGLPPIGEAARVIAMKVRGVFFLFKDGFPKKNEGPGDVGAIGHLPFAPNTKEGIPGLLNRDAFHEIVLGGLRESLVATLAGSLDSHDLEPGTYRQPVIKDQPGERPHLAWAGIMPHSGDDLGDRGVAKIQLLDEGDDVGSVLLPPGIPVSSLSRVTKERGIAHVVRLLPVPVSGIPWEVINKTGLEDPINWRFFTWGRYFLDQSERCSMAILGEDPDRHVPVKGDGDAMRAGSLDSTRVRGFFEFLGVGGVVCYIGDLIDPFRRGDPVSFLFADPVPYHRFVTGDGWVPWDAGYNEVPI